MRGRGVEDGDKVPSLRDKDPSTKIDLIDHNRPQWIHAFARMTIGGAGKPAGVFIVYICIIFVLLCRLILCLFFQYLRRRGGKSIACNCLDYQ